MGTKVSDMQKNVTPGRRKGCPNYPPEFKQQLVAASCEPGISISKLALENGINANLLFKWRQQCKRLVRTVLIFTESSDQLSRATDRVPGLPASPGYVQ
ncbi:TPA: transposase [Escherichia coli]|nr:transposase [Escherichia coli]HBE6121136.1 transposase [Escherichia coli]HBE6157036.1 transposase [Escherichia coli]HBE6179435.1 transposase [Escherichia coli]HBE6184044.1 transposase [Escherichia coli]